MLADPGCEPTDEELEALMRAMQRAVREKGAASAAAAQQRLARALRQGAEDRPPLPPSPSLS